MKRNRTAVILIMVLTQLLITVAALAQVQLGQAITGTWYHDLLGHSVSMPDTRTMAIGVPQTEGGAQNQLGYTKVYTWAENHWQQKGSTLYGEALNDAFGGAVSMPDTNTLAVGAWRNDGGGSSSGHVRVFRWDGSDWTQKGQDIDGEYFIDFSGTSVSMPDSNTVAIGATNNINSNGTTGHVRVYAWDPVTSLWIQKGDDINGSSEGDAMGQMVSMPDSNTVAIGAPQFAQDDTGYVRVFRWDGAEWSQKGADIIGEGLNDRSGIAVSMPDSNTIAIGADYNSGNGFETGHVRVFDWDGNTWVQRGMDIDGDSIEGHAGRAVSMPNVNTVAIGIPHDYIGTGYVQVYNWSGTDWVQNGMNILGPEPGYLFGDALDMPDNMTVCVGAQKYFASQDLYRAGQVRVYALRGIGGQIFNDLNQNCQQDQQEFGLVGGITGVIEPGGAIVQTTEDGRWFTDTLPSGNYSVTFDTTTGWIPSCASSQYFTVINSDTLIVLEPFPIYNNNPCIKPDVSVNMPFMRPCFTDQSVYIQACNGLSATASLDDPYLEIQLDSAIHVQSASAAYTVIGDNRLRFDVDTLYPGQCVDISLLATVSCGATLGQSLCMQAELLPIEACALDTLPSYPQYGSDTCNLPYDGSHIELDAWCANDSIYFTITNTALNGVGDMQCSSPAVVLVDGNFHSIGSVMLEGGQTDTLALFGDGRTWRLEVDQHPFHPGASHPNITIELCGDANNWTPNLVAILPQDDADPHRDIYCGVVTASYDPNDKTGIPLGTTQEHWIAPNGSIDYTIRFQNTGSDTAFTVIIRDTLDSNFDIFSIHSGVASHDYEFEMYGPRVLQWTFENIMLPDSGTDYAGSNGFVTFKVDQLNDLSDGTQLINSADIYFDYNAPIITNSTSHIVNRRVYDVPWSEQILLSDTACLSYTFNNTNYDASGTYYQIIADTLVTLTLAIGSMPDTSVTINSPTLSSIIANASYQWFDCENPSAPEPIPGATEQSFTATENGNYAVAITYLGCSELSSCHSVDNVSILENSSELSIELFPNPNHGRFWLNFGTPPGSLRIDVYNLIGDLVQSDEYNSANTIEYHLQGPSGVYLVHIVNDENLSRTFKVVKE